MTSYGVTTPFRPTCGRTGAGTTAVAAAVSNAYNGLENVLSNLARDTDGSVPQGESWHQDLLDQMLADMRGIRPPLLDVRLPHP